MKASIGDMMSIRERDKGLMMVATGFALSLLNRAHAHVVKPVNSSMILGMELQYQRELALISYLRGDVKGELIAGTGTLLRKTRMWGREGMLFPLVYALTSSGKDNAREDQTAGNAW
jgi:hypothetical protein